MEKNSVSGANLLAAQPTVTRGQSYHFDVDASRGRLVYTSGRAVYMRDISKPDIAYAFTEHTSNTTVSRISSDGRLVASGDACGNIRIWDPARVEMVTLKPEPGSITKYHAPILQGSILDISWDSDGQRVLAVGDGKEKFGHVFNAETGASIGEICGHSRRINACSIRPVLRPMKAVTGGDDTLVALYQGPPFKYQSSLKHHTKMVQDVKYSPKGDLFASVGSDGGIFIYDGSTGELKQSPSHMAKDSGSGHSSGVLGVSWEPESSSSAARMCTCSSDGTVKIWDVPTSKLLQTFSIGSPQVGCAWTTSPSKSDLIISVDAPDGSFSYLDPRSGPTPVQRIHGHVKAITALHCEPGQDTFYTGGCDGKIYAWSVSDLSRGATPVLLSHHEDVHIQPQNVLSSEQMYLQSKKDSDSEISGQVVSIIKSQESLLSIGQDDQLVSIRPYENVYLRQGSTVISDKYADMQTQAGSRPGSPNLRTTEAPVTMINLPLLPDSLKDISPGNIVLYEHCIEWREDSRTDGGKHTSVTCNRISLGPDLTMNCIASSNIKPILAVGCKENPNIYIIEYNLAERRLTHNDKISPVQGKSKGFIAALSYSPDGRWLAVADSGRQILLYDVETMNVESWPPKWTHHTSRIQCMAWNPNSLLLASGSLDGNIIIWRVGRPANERKTISRAHQDGVNSLAFVDESSLISCGQDGCLRRWIITIDN